MPPQQANEKPNPSSTTNVETIKARAAVATADLQRLVSSWLPPPTEEELSASYADRLTREEEEAFTAEPEL